MESIERDTNRIENRIESELISISGVDNRSISSSNKESEEKNDKAEILTTVDDTRKYKVLKLKNQMKVMLISDPEALISSACILNPRGSFSDPYSRQGLTHFLEHMLFLGSEKYPEPNFYRDFVTKNGGRCNAWTYWRSTLFHFEVHHNSFSKTLDVLVELLKRPLLDTQMAKREIWAVNYEHLAASSKNLRRYRSIFRDLAHPDSVFKKYLLGNVFTLDAVKANYEEESLASKSLAKIDEIDSGSRNHDDIHQHHENPSKAKRKQRESMVDYIDKIKFRALMRDLRNHHKNTIVPGEMVAVLMSNSSLQKLENLSRKFLGKMPENSRISDHSRQQRSSLSQNTGFL